MEHVHMDMLGPFPQSEWGNKYILVMVDQFSKWVEIHAIPDISAEQTTRCAIDQFFSRTTPYHPCSNGQVKRYNSLLLQIVCCYLHAKDKTWDQDLQLSWGHLWYGTPCHRV